MQTNEDNLSSTPKKKDDMKHPSIKTNEVSARDAYTFDFHIHTKYSKDSIQDPKQIVKFAIKKNLAGIAITDHNTIKGGLKTKSISNDNLIVIVGSEIQTDKGELIGLFLNEEIKSNKYFQVCDEIREQDGVIILPHPYRSKMLEPTKETLESVDIIEGLNARTSHELNQKAQALAEKLGLPSVAGSDAHIPIEIGRVQTILLGNEINSDEESLKKKLLNSHMQTCGTETPLYISMLSKSIGRYKTSGAKGLINSGINMIFK